MARKAKVLCVACNALGARRVPNVSRSSLGSWLWKAKSPPMPNPLARPVSGHVFRVERQRGPVWYAKYRLPDGRQVQRKLGPAWTRQGRPAVVLPTFGERAVESITGR
jgi:hypothetical protein